jgi:putative ABC transport system permease protein
VSRTLLRLLAGLYPRSIRIAYADDLTMCLEQSWREQIDQRGVGGPMIAFMRALKDVLRARLTTRAERRYLRHRAGTPRRGPGRDWLGDVRYAARSYRRSPAFFAGLVITLALGIGANAAVFSLVKAVVLQPLPYDRPHELFMAWRSLAMPTEFWRWQTTPRFLLAWRQQTADLATIAAVAGYGTLDAQMDFVSPGGTERLNGAFATSNFFDVLGVRPAQGRVFTTTDEAAGRTDVVVLSHSLWTRAFGGDASVVGRTIELTTGRGRRRMARPFTVIGVLPPRFHFNYPDHVEIWAPRLWTAIEAEPLDAIGYQVVGRLRPGVSFAQASSRFAALHEIIQPPPQDIAPEQRRTTKLEPIHESIVADSRRMMGLLAAVAALLLVITCTTVCNALLIRVTERQRELAMRAALGASRARLLRQLLIEGSTLAAISAAAGVVLAMAVMPWLRALVPASVPRAGEIGVDASVLAFALAAAIVVTIIAAVVPAWRGARLDAASRLKQGSGTASADRSTTLWRKVLVGLQAAMAAALLASAALLLTSFWRLTQVPLGFAADDVITAELRVLDPALATEEGLRPLQAAVLAKVSAVSGVRRVAMASAIPFRGVDWQRDVEVPDGPTFSPNIRHVDPLFFDLMGMRLLRGRVFDGSDVPGSPPAAVVSQSLARAAFGDVDPIGRTLTVRGPVTIVGVVDDVRYVDSTRAPRHAVYLPAAQQPSELICLLIDSNLDAGTLAGELKRAVAEIAPSVPVMNVTTIGDIVYRSLEDRRFYTTATAMFAALALVLTVAGLVVIVSRSIVERRRELAIRRALGATAARLQARVVWQGLLPVAAGCGAGLAMAFAAASTLASFLFDVHPRDGWLYATPALLMIAAAALTSLVVSRRATAIQPSIVLRLE